MSRTARPIVALGSALTLIAAAVITYVVWPRHAAAAPTAAGPAGTTYTVTALKEPPSDFTLSAFAQPLGQPFEITPSKPAAGSRVTSPVDPDTDLAAIDGYRPSGSNLFIAVYEPGLAAWVPLRSTYDPATRTLSAQTPHFSKFWKSVLKVARRIDESLTGGVDMAQGAVTGFLAYEQEILDGVADEVKKDFLPTQQHADCSSADPSYSVAADFEPDRFPGCVSTASGSAVLSLENHLALPFGLQGTQDTHPQTRWSTYEGLTDFAAGLYYKALGGTYLPPHGVGALSMGNALAGTPQWRGTLHLDWFAFAMSVALGTLSVIPASKSFVTLTATLKSAMIRVADENGVTDVTSLVLTVEREQQDVVKPEMIEHLGGLSDLVTCARRISEGPDQHDDVQTVAESVASAAKGCAGTVISQWVDGGKSAVADILSAIPDLLGSVRGIWQAAVAGPALNSFGVEVNRTSAADGGSAPSTDPNTGEGTLTIVPDHDYILALDQPFPIARIAGADVGHLTGTQDGVEIWDAYALPMPTGVAGGYQPCLDLPWTSNDAWSGQHVIPWAELAPGKQICVQTTYSGLFISLLTVTARPTSTSVTFSVSTWACDARPDEAAIC